MAKVVYIGIGPEEGMVVEESEAFEYALRESLFGDRKTKEDFRSMLVEWFYSGNFVKEEVDEA